MNHLCVGILWLFTLFITSCATITPPPAAHNEKLTWHERAQTLSSITHWNIQALLAVRANKTQESWSANLQWQQNKQFYTLNIFGPLGASAVELQGRPGKVQLTTADGKTFTARTPEGLLAQQVGWNIPISSLYYWIRGIPVPGIPAQLQFDDYHHLTQLTQQGWHVQFIRYSAMNHVDLPSKIYFDNPQLNAKIVIHDWAS